LKNFSKGPNRVTNRSHLFIKRREREGKHCWRSERVRDSLLCNGDGIIFGEVQEVA